MAKWVKAANVCKKCRNVGKGRVKEVTECQNDLIEAKMSQIGGEIGKIC